MRLRSRIRKIIKWCALGSFVALLGLILMSGWYEFDAGITRLDLETHVKYGRLSLLRWKPGYISNFFEISHIEYGSRHPSSVPEKRVIFRWDYESEGGNTYRIPLWWGLPPLAGIWFITWRPDRAAAVRARAGRCSKCGYHRAGLKPDALCPECGAGVKA